MWVERIWSDAVEALARSFPAVLLTGPRQVGKTSLLRRLFPRATFVTFDDVALARQAQTQPDTFLSSQAQPLILDEVQYVPSLFRDLKRHIDRDGRPGRFLMTGSQTFPLMQGVSESMAGRCAVAEMTSLSFAEVSAAQPGAGDLGTLVRGGFPALWSGQVEDARDFYTAYTATYLERDVRNLKQVGDLRDFHRFLRAAAIRTGQMLSYSDLARDVGVAPNTAKAWVSVMAASGQIHLLEPYHRSLGKRLVKSPKLYFLDTGLACHLVGIHSVAELLASPLAGALWETFVVGEVVRSLRAQRDASPLWYWRTSSGAEVDLLVERGGRFVAIECKLGEAPGPEALGGIRALAAFYDPREISKALVACRTPAPYAIREKPRAKAIGVAGLARELRRG